jgi:hypothetical protein
MTRAESEEARRRMRASRAQDRTERRLFENLAEIRAIEEQARSATSRRKAERTRLANKAARENLPGKPGESGPAETVSGAAADTRRTADPAKSAGPDRLGGQPACDEPMDPAAPGWAGQTIAPFGDVERL